MLGETRPGFMKRQREGETEGNEGVVGENGKLDGKIRGEVKYAQTAALSLSLLSTLALAHIAAIPFHPIR